MPKLHKHICQKCYLYHERVWTKNNEEDWSEGFITCPVDHFDVISHKGEPVRVDKPTRNLFGAIFGWIKNTQLPKWCQYAKEHRKKPAPPKKRKKRGEDPAE